jgi:hypothetical protein
MLMVVEYRFRGDEDYYVTAYAKYRRQLWWYRWLWPARVLAIGLVALALIFSFPDLPLIALMLCLLLGAGLWSLLFASLRGAVLRRRIRKIAALNDDWVIRLSDDGMYSSSKRSEGRLDWSGFSRARRLTDGLLLFQGHLFHWLPDSARTHPALPSEVGDLVRRHVSDYRDVGRPASSDGTQTARGFGLADSRECDPKPLPSCTVGRTEGKSATDKIAAAHVLDGHRASPLNGGDAAKTTSDISLD